MAISVRYSTFDRDGFSTGAHVAAIVGKVGKREVAREEVAFSIASVDDGDAPIVREPVARGPAPMSTQAFAGFLAALNGTS